MDKKKKRKQVPSNVISGVAYGTKSLLKNVIGAVMGVVLEPVRGVWKGGVKGGAIGLGKGILGLVCKPVAGTIDLVTQTTRGIGNTPKTVYVQISKLIKVKKTRRKKWKYEYPPI